MACVGERHMRVRGCVYVREGEQLYENNTFLM